MTEAGYEIRCNSCFAAVPSTAETCPACGTVLLGPATPPPMSAAIIAAADSTAVAAAVSSPRVPRGAAPYATYDGAYGGLWIRGSAWLFDTIIFVPLVLAALAFPLAWLVVIPLVWLYHPVMESSRWQATLGKRLCGLAVVNTGGRRISFVRALVRHFAKYLSGALFGIGFLMIALTREKRGLHDMIAGTLVIWR